MDFERMITAKEAAQIFVLRRIGRADLWLVVAIWELTAVEKAALDSPRKMRRFDVLPLWLPFLLH